MSISTVCVEIFRNPRLKQALSEYGNSGKISTPYADLIPILIRLGLCEGEGDRATLTRLGHHISYHLTEYRIQAEGDSFKNSITLLDLRPDSRVLDIGCGAGQSLVAMVGRQRPGIAVGLEFSHEALEIFSGIREFLGINRTFGIRGNAERLPFRDCSFDRILGRGVLTYVQVPLALREIARVTDSGGLVYLHLTDAWYYMLKLLRWDAGNGRVPFALMNGLLFQLLGIQVRMGNSLNMNYETVADVSRRLKALNFEIVSVEQDPRGWRWRKDHLNPKILARKR